MLTSMGEGTPGFQSEARRFDTDSAAEEHQFRMKRVDRHNRIIEQKRAVNISREEEHWRRQEAERRAEEERQRQLREHSMKVRSSPSSPPLNTNDGSVVPLTRCCVAGVPIRRRPSPTSTACHTTPSPSTTRTGKTGSGCDARTRRPATKPPCAPRCCRTVTCQPRTTR